MNASVTRFSRLGPHHLPLRVHVQSDQPPQPPHRRPTSLKPASMTQPLPTHPTLNTHHHIAALDSITDLIHLAFKSKLP
uniref:Uncharacterized protein n=1 Tax=Mesocestoides corti TaxID=53468 RepID=A0A5K3G8F2_MESCO